MTARRPIVVVGIGEDGWAGLSGGAAEALTAARVIVGSPRQLDLVSSHVSARSVTWPTPLLPAVRTLLQDHPERPVTVLASGDPLLFGIGNTLVSTFGAGAVDVVPHVSSVALACARLGWPVHSTPVVSLVARPDGALAGTARAGLRLVVLVEGPDGAARVASILTSGGLGGSEITVLEALGGPGEGRLDGVAAAWAGRRHGPLAVVAVDCRAGSADPEVSGSGGARSEGAGQGRSVSRVPGLRDHVFDSDGTMTKREVRAVTLSSLAPVAGETLWDIGAGSGSISVEWVRAATGCRAFAVEPRTDRRERIAANAVALDAFGVELVAGSAPDALAGLPAPDAVFVGGGLTEPGVAGAALEALARRPGGGGRLVANAATLQSERVLGDLHDRLGGELIRLEVSRATPLGGFTAWRPMIPVTQWVYLVPGEAPR